MQEQESSTTLIIKTFATLLFVTGLVLNAHATAQMAERLLYKGETNRLCTLPLEAYLKQHELRLYKIAPPKKFTISTVCWGGYIGTWEIKEGFLWLLRMENLDGTEVPLSKIFPGDEPTAQARFSPDGKEIVTTKAERPIKATWYSGTLHVTHGKMLEYVHADFESKFERDIYIEIEKRKVTGERVVENKPTEPATPK